LAQLGELLNGFHSLLSMAAMIAMFAGVLLGIIFGALPGLSATIGMAILLPVAYNLDVTIGLIMFGGIYAGALYGGSISAILLGIPGTAAALPTTFDGFPMSKSGRAYEALLAGLYGSGIGGIFSAIVLMFLTPPIAVIAIKFGPPEMFALGIWGISMVINVMGGDVIKGIFMALLGLVIGLVGADPVNGVARFTFGNYNLFGGFSLVSVLLGVLALPRVYEMVVSFKESRAFFQPQTEKKYFMRAREVFVHAFLIARSAVLGCFIGIAPAAGPTVAALISYNMAKKASKKDPESFGKGNVEGVFAAETANNAATGGSLVFALSLGVPGSGAAAVFMSALIMRGIQPGPLLLINNADIVYTFFASFLVVNIFVFLIGHLFVQAGPYVLRTPIKLLVPVILMISIIGTFSAAWMFGVYVTFIISIIAYFLDTMDFPIPPFLLSLILVGMIESNLWTMYDMTYGKIYLVFKRPMFLFLITFALLPFVLPVIKLAMSKIKPKNNNIKR